jgi:hypothetical protein
VNWKSTVKLDEHERSEMEDRSAVKLGAVNWKSTVKLEEHERSEMEEHRVQ